MKLVRELIDSIKQIAFALLDIKFQLQQMNRSLAKIAEEPPILEEVVPQYEPGLYRQTQEGANDYELDRNRRENIARNQDVYDWRERE